MRLTVLAFITCGLAGCGAAYFSPSVQEGTDGESKVRVLAMTASSALVANQSAYSPKSLPSVFFTTAGTGAQRSSPVPPPAPTLQENRPAALERRLPPAISPSPYLIGVGDILLLATPRNATTVEELSGLLAAQNRRQGYTVQDDGAIAIPDVGRFMVEGMTIEQAEAALFERLVAAQIDPSFSLEVTDFNSKRISIGGAVARPGVAPITLSPLYLEEALAQAGGVSAPDIDFATIRLYRDGTLFQIPVSDLYAGTLDRILLQDRDAIFVDSAFSLDQAQAYFAEQIRLAQFKQSGRSQALAELQAEINLRRNALNEARSNFRAQSEFDAVERDYVYLTGEVNTQARVALPFGRTASLADVLFDQGGFNTRTGNPQQVYVLRGSPNPREFAAVDAWQLDLTNAANFVVASRFEMRPNDIVFVAEQPVTRWNRVVNQITPALINTGVRATTN